MGSAQTVPRVELFSIACLCLLIGPQSAISVVSDSALCVAGIAKRQRSGENWDLWERRWTVVTRKHLRLECQWVKPHGDEHPECFIKYNP